MTKGIKLFRIFGITISIDYSWFIVFVLFAWSLAYGYYPYYYPGFGKQSYIIIGTVSSLLLFICVLIHELSHSVVANRLGLDISGITLFIFGGVAEMTKEPEEAMVELKIAAAGPIASAILGGLFYLAAKALPAAGFPLVNAVLLYLSLINFILMGFNLIPGFPLDGGRVLRSLWWAWTGDVYAATRAASQSGRIFALFLIIFGFFQIFMGNLIGGLWMALIGIFLQQAAVSGYQQLVVKKILSKVKVRDVMSTEVVSISEEATISEAVDKYFLTHHFVSFPVTSMGKTTGIITFKAVKSLARERWAEVPVSDVMIRIDEKGFLTPGENAMDALTKIVKSGIGRLPVVDKGRLVGMVSRGDLLRIIELKTSLKV
ncbi:MAG: site-2 protease family protein [Thermodesulfobacteriota bacterium]|nr:MAG: site-2 protease family protein [Thermodesulfobacteriota bacterium]